MILSHSTVLKALLMICSLFFPCFLAPTYIKSFTSIGKGGGKSDKLNEVYYYSDNILTTHKLQGRQEFQPDIDTTLEQLVSKKTKSNNDRVLYSFEADGNLQNKLTLMDTWFA